MYKGHNIPETVEPTRVTALPVENEKYAPSETSKSGEYNGSTVVCKGGEEY